jgi:hypothetical protein
MAGVLCVEDVEEREHTCVGVGVCVCGGGGVDPMGKWEGVPGAVGHGAGGSGRAVAAGSAAVSARQRPMWGK